MAFVYMWFDITSGLRYIGVHKGTPEDGYVCSSEPMLLEYKKRPEEFRRQIMYHGTWKNMLEIEQSLIVEHDAVKSKKFYNQANGLGPYHKDWTGIRRCEATKKKMRKPKSKEHRENISAGRAGIKFSEEHRARIAAAATGRIFSEEHKTKIGVALAGKVRGPYRKTNNA